MLKPPKGFISVVGDGNPFWDSNVHRVECERRYIWDEFNEYGHGYGRIIDRGSRKVY